MLAACRASAFLATLTDSQRRAVVTEFTAEQAARWSNLPCGTGCRNGLHIGDLTEPQRVAALALAEAALGPRGYATLEELRKADAYLAAQPQGQGSPGPPPGGAPPDRARGGPPGGPPGARPGGPPGGPGGDFGYGEGRYVVAFLGTPSDTGRWLLQIGGHHLAFNVSFAGGSTAVSPTPNFVGVEPTSFTLNGARYTPLAARRDAIYALVGALTPAQRDAARLAQSFDDVVVGPGRDGKFPTPTGIAGSALTPAQRVLLREAIEGWVRDAPPALAGALMNDYGSAAALAATRVSWSGATAPTVAGSYVRIDGPRVWIEFACQNGVVLRDRIHYHTIWRDKERDYGGTFRW